MKYNGQFEIILINRVILNYLIHYLALKIKVLKNYLFHKYKFVQR